jgi:hypothetical protein
MSHVLSSEKKCALIEVAHDPIEKQLRMNLWRAVPG